jgi:hypothetical protein
VAFIKMTYIITKALVLIKSQCSKFWEKTHCMV